MTSWKMPTRFAALLLLPILLFVSACDRHDHDDDHLGLTRVLVLDRSDNNNQLAQWTRTGGWDVASLPALTIGGEPTFGRSSLTIQIFEGDEQIEMATVENPGGGQPRVCTEYSARYWVTQTNDVLYDPGNTGLVDVGGQTRNTFHCDHLHVYPRTAGTAQIEFVLWHVDHEDGRTDPISITVQQ